MERTRLLTGECGAREFRPPRCGPRLTCRGAGWPHAPGRALVIFRNRGDFEGCLAGPGQLHPVMSLRTALWCPLLLAFGLACTPTADDPAPAPSGGSGGGAARGG